MVQHLAALFVFYAAGTAGVASAATISTGDAQCPCISPDLSAHKVGDYLQVQSHGKQYNYNPNYGQQNCTAWDSPEQPYCADSSAVALAARPDW